MNNNKVWRDVLGWVLLLAITAVAFWLRLRMLEIKPLHHDEGVNAWFVHELVDKFKYRYNPYFYHGPALYFLTAPAFMILGETVQALRLLPAITGALAVPAFYLVKDRVGWLGVLLAGGVMAVSTIEVYFSRTAIHEIYNGTFNLTLVGGLYWWWRRGAPGGLYLAAASLALLFATKETTVITLAAVGPAVVVAWLLTDERLRFPGGRPLPQTVVDEAPAAWRQLQLGSTPGQQAEPWPPEAAPLSVHRAGERLAEALAAAQASAREALRTWEEARAQAEAAHLDPPHRLGSAYEHLATGARVSLPIVGFVWTIVAELWRRDRRTLITAGVIALAIWAALFSSLGTYPQGIGAFFEAFFGWGKTGVEGKGHEKIWHYFITELLIPYYQPLVYVGLPALVLGAVRRDSFALFNLVWFALALAAYSVIPYKTPWCTISFVTPLFFGVAIAGQGLAALGAKVGGGVVGGAASLAPVLLAAYPFYTYSQASWKVQFEEYDVDGHAFIYVQNVREFMDLVDDMTHLLQATDAAGQKPKLYTVRAHNPLRFYLGQWMEGLGYANEYTDGIAPRLKAADVIVAQKSQSKKVREALDVDNFVVREYHERPGQKLELFVAKKYWETYEAAVARGEVPGPSAPGPARSFSDDRSKELRAARKKR